MATQTPKTQALAKSRYSIIKDKFTKWAAAPDFRQLLPKHVDPDRVLRVALANISKTPLLQQCSEESLWRALAAAAELGLEPGGALGYCYLVPYKDTAQFIVGWQGLIELGRRSGTLKQIEVHLVYRDEHFRYRILAEGTLLEHEPKPQKDVDSYVRGYCIARLKDGGVHVEHMWREEIEAIRNKANAYVNELKKPEASRHGPWFKHPSEMAKKTIVRRAFKYLPKSPELARAFDADDYDTEKPVNEAIRTSVAPPVPDAPVDAELVEEPPTPPTPHDPVTGVVDEEEGTGVEEPPDDVPLPTAGEATASSTPVGEAPPPTPAAEPTGPTPGTVEYGEWLLSALDACVDEGDLARVSRLLALQENAPPQMRAAVVRQGMKAKSAIRAQRGGA